MNNILFDLSCLQAGPKAGGAAAYAKTILDQLIATHDSDVRIFGLYNSTQTFHPLYEIEMVTTTNNIQLLDISRTSISLLIQQYNINTFFIPVGQYIIPYNLSNIFCRTIIVIHDIFDIESSQMGLDAILHDPNLQSKKGLIKNIIHHYIGRKKHIIQKKYAELLNFCSQQNVHVFSVSEYSKVALQYHCHALRNKDIDVLYSPAKKVVQKTEIENQELASLIENKHKYFLLISANRIYKNAYNVLNAFKLFSDKYPEYHIVTINYPRSLFPNHISLSTLSESDLEFAYQHTEALIFASFFEGFGYPPIEAMKYGKPVLASNATSIPEITGIGGIYFSPFYSSDIYHALTTYMQTNISTLKQNSLNQHQTITAKQVQDLRELVDLIIANG